MQVDRRTSGMVVMKGAFRVRSVGRLKEKQFGWRKGEVVLRDVIGWVKETTWVGEK